MPDAVLRAENLTKRYGGITALEDVSLSLAAGEVLALLGANGAGKSTLVKLLSGNILPDGGSIAIGGEGRHLTSPRMAFEAGVATVHQELSLFGSLTVAQNVLIGREERGRFGHIREDASLRRTEALLAEIGVPDIAADARVGTLSLAQRQLVEIAKAMSFDPRVLILDEPTSALGLTDVHRLLTVVRGLRAKGRAIIFISHRMEEIEDIADSVTILRSGRKVGAFPRHSFTRERALELMLGETQQQLHAVPPPPAPPDSTPPILQVADLRLDGRLNGVSFDLRPGEVLGLAGLEGQGQKDMLFALFGLFRRGLRGDVIIRGQARRASRPLQAIAAGLAFIPDDRKNMGGFMFLPIAHNVTITILNRLRRFLFLDSRQEKAVVSALIRQLAIKCSSADAPLGSLSGGNQQKVIAAKWLAFERDIYLFCDPTRGVDAGARETIYATIRDLAAAGKGIILYSTDMVEFPILCSRVLVFRGGKIAGAVSGAEINEESILALSFRDTGTVAA
ncbi:sugar ABC transporter ATP-binding protein [Acidisoma cellulosilytica]|uniref:Sugar ABC transporter ATP-binding protein n=1 Tax=Acidisoma cellulosilyticum TaxID=2802395 RepID=A0A963Z566_9PROT|nr:sugar ABC transporter ATP-binding protein [Acidisoma cellulosilyticum]MCB8882245.1 sugar ABC transporter ATP-binding protein [Acidisoma cellulosilyticum]